MTEDAAYKAAADGGGADKAAAVADTKEGASADDWGDEDEEGDEDDEVNEGSGSQCTARSGREEKEEGDH